MEITLLQKSQRPETAGFPSPQTGFVFALPIESAGVLDRLQNRKTTKGNGRTFYTGLFAGQNVVVIEAGIGQDAAQKATEILCDVFAPKRICNAGYAGGLSKRMKPLTMCIPQQVVRQIDGSVLDLTKPVPQQIERRDDRLTLLTADKVVASPQEKQELGERFNAELVDMETFAVADVCRKRQVAFVSVRIIFDAVSEPIPPEIMRIQNAAQSGAMRLTGTVLGTICKRPSTLLDLFSLKTKALKATDKLAKQIAIELRRK